MVTVGAGLLLGGEEVGAGDDVGAGADACVAGFAFGLGFGLALGLALGAALVVVVEVELEVDVEDVVFEALFLLAAGVLLLLPQPAIAIATAIVVMSTRFMGTPCFESASG